MTTDYLDKRISEINKTLGVSSIDEGIKKLELMEQTNDRTISPVSK